MPTHLPQPLEERERLLPLARALAGGDGGREGEGVGRDAPLALLHRPKQPDDARPVALRRRGQLRGVGIDVPDKERTWSVGGSFMVGDWSRYSAVSKAGGSVDGSSPRPSGGTSAIAASGPLPSRWSLIRSQWRLTRTAVCLSSR